MSLSSPNLFCPSDTVSSNLFDVSTSIYSLYLIKDYSYYSLTFWYFLLCSFRIKSTVPPPKQDLSFFLWLCATLSLSLYSRGDSIYILYVRERVQFLQDRPYAYVSGCNSTHPPVALQGRDLLRQLRLNSLHDNS